MGIFTKLKSKTAKKSLSQSIELDNLYRFLGIDSTSKNLQEATYYTCLKVLSEAVGKLPLKLLEHTDEQGSRTVREHPLFSIVRDRPNPYMTSTTFWSTVEWYRNHYGNAYVWIQGSGSNVKLWILPPNEVEIWMDDAKILADIPDIYYIYGAKGRNLVFGSEEILHFKTSQAEEGIIGKSVRDQLKDTIESGKKSQTMLNKLYDNGFTAKAVLQYTGNLNDESAKKFVAGIERYAKGEMKSDGVENIIPIPLGAELKPLNTKLADNQFIELRRYSSLQIASAFGIKPYQIGDYTKSSYASAEAQQLSFYVDTLLYILKQYEEELTYKLLTEQEIKKGRFFKFNIDAILRADFATKVNTLSTAVNSFLMTPNEARSKLDLNNLEGGDRLLGNGASIPVELTGAQYTQTDEEV